MKIGMKNLDHKKLIDALENCGLSKMAIAKKWGFALSTVYSWFNGTNPTEDTVKIISQKLNVSPDSFLMDKAQLQKLNSNYNNNYKTTFNALEILVSRGLSKVFLSFLIDNYYMIEKNDGSYIGLISRKNSELINLDYDSVMQMDTEKLAQYMNFYTIDDLLAIQERILNYIEFEIFYNQNTRRRSYDDLNI